MTAAARQPSEPSSHGALTTRQRLGYAVGDLGINFYFAPALTYLLFFYTDVFGLAPAVAASVFLVARVVDAVTDPLMGWIADRTRHRSGRFRPWLLWGSIPLALITIATWTTPPLGETGRIAWAYATYIGFGIAYTVVSIPYSALTAALTSNYAERTRLSTLRMLCAFAGGWTVSVITLPLVGLAPDPQSGFTWTMCLYAVIATLLLWLCFAGTRETNLPAAAPRVPLRSALRAITGNPPLLVFMLIFSLGMLALTVRQTAALYYFKYNLGRADLIPWFFFITMPLMMAGLAVVPWLADTLGKARALAMGAAVTAASGVAIWFVPPDAIVTLFVLFGIGAIGGAPIAALGWAMLPDTVEYAQWRTGIRADGVIYSTASFMQKVAKAVGGAGAAAVLAAWGYVANVDQSDTSLVAIAALISLVPAAILVLMMVACGFYRLDAASHGRIVAELEARAA